MLSKWLGSPIPMPMAHRRLAVVGWVLYSISWLTPSLDSQEIGAHAFIVAGGYGLLFFFQGWNPSGIAIGVCLLFGWLSNFSIFIPISVRARLVWILAPWFPFVVALFSMNTPTTTSARAINLLYFYPWAIGIALIHLANVAEARGRKRTPMLDGHANAP
jgi:hypothetical protein